MDDIVFLAVNDRHVRQDHAFVWVPGRQQGSAVKVLLQLLSG